MNIIKFSHDFEKLPVGWENTLAILHSVLIIDVENQTKEFLNYNTTIRAAKKQYKLPKRGMFLLLLFIHESGGAFTTLKKFAVSKYHYYNKKKGRKFRLVFEKH